MIWKNFLGTHIIISRLTKTYEKWVNEIIDKCCIVITDIETELYMP